MVSYQQMLDECERAGHDMTGAKAAYAKPIAPAPSRNANHNLVRAIAAGFAPVIKEHIDALRAENALLRQRMDALEARQTAPNLRRVV